MADPLGRLHHPLTTVRKVRRQRVRVAADLVAVDVGARQPAVGGLAVLERRRMRAAPDTVTAPTGSR